MIIKVLCVHTKPFFIFYRKKIKAQVRNIHRTRYMCEYQLQPNKTKHFSLHLNTHIMKHVYLIRLP